MAFTNTSGRYASFGFASELPGQVIDSFWYIIDNNLKGVFVLEPIINFDILLSSTTVVSSISILFIFIFF